MWHEVLEFPFPEGLGIPDNCRLALVCLDDESCPLVIGSAARSADSLKQQRVWFETWARFLNNRSVHWSEKARCLEAIEAFKEAARRQKEAALRVIQPVSDRKVA